MIVHNTATTDDKKLQSTLKKLSVNTIPGIEEVNMIKDDGSVIHFNNPKVQGSPYANTFAVTGHGENKMLTEMLPSILNQLGAEGIGNLRKLASQLPQKATDEKAAEEDKKDEKVPEMTGDFDEPSKTEEV